TDRVIRHDLRLVLKAIADVAVLVAERAYSAIVLLVFVIQVGIPLVVVAFPGDVVFQQHVANAALRSGGNRERRVVRVGVGIGIGAIPEISRVVVIEQIV